MTPEMQDLAVF